MDRQPVYIWTTCRWCRCAPAGRLPDGTAVCLQHYRRWVVAWFADLCTDPLAGETVLEHFLQAGSPCSMRELAARCPLSVRRVTSTLLDLQAAGVVEPAARAGVPRDFKLSDPALRCLQSEELYFPARFRRLR